MKVSNGTSKLPSLDIRPECATWVSLTCKVISSSVLFDMDEFHGK